MYVVAKRIYCIGILFSDGGARLLLDSWRQGVDFPRDGCSSSSNSSSSSSSSSNNSLWQTAAAAATAATAAAATAVHALFFHSLQNFFIFFSPFLFACYEFQSNLWIGGVVGCQEMNMTRARFIIRAGDKSNQLSQGQNLFAAVERTVLSGRLPYSSNSREKCF